MTVVSRSACEAQAKATSSGSVSLHVVVKSTAYVRRTADLSKATAHTDGDQLQVSRESVAGLAKAVKHFKDCGVNRALLTCSWR